LKCKETYDWDMPIQLEIEMKLGGSHATMTKYDFSKLKLLDIVEKTMQWQKEELGYDYPTEQIIQAVEHNWDLIWPYRKQELEKMEGYTPGKEMLLTPKIASTLNWKLVPLKGADRVPF
jgi:hypothetical protein